MAYVAIVAPTTDDPLGLHGAPFAAPGPKRMTNVASPAQFSPKGHLWVAITTYNPPYMFHGLDSNGYWFHGQAGISGGSLYDSDYPGADDRSWFDKAVDFVGKAIVDVGIPALAAALAVAAPGIGSAAGVALLAWRGLAQGRSLSDALIAAESADLSKTPTELTAFQDGLAQVKSGLSAEQLISYAHTAIPAGLEAARKAFFMGAQIQRARQTQDVLTAGLKYYLVHSPAVDSVHTGSWWDTGTLDHAMQWGSDFGSVMFGLRGKAGVDMLGSISDQAARLVDHLQARPDLLKIIADNPDVANQHFSYAPPASSSRPVPSRGGSGGGGVFVLAAAAAGAVAVLKSRH